jgi:hypothetical protein
MSTTDRYKKLGLSARQGNKFKSDLQNHHFITPVQIDRKIMLELTEPARNHLADKGFKIPIQARGGVEHNFALHRLKEHFRSKEGFPFIEKDDIDLVVEHYDTTTLIQVETGKSNISKNVETILSREGNRRIMIATNADAEAKIRQAIDGCKLPGKTKIEISQIKDFLSQN